MPINVSHIDPQTVNFRDLTRDQLRALARQHNVRGTSSYNPNVTYAPGSASKEELIRGLNSARTAGKFRNAQASQSSTPAGITVLNRNPIIVMEGKGCGNSGKAFAAAEWSVEHGAVRLAPDFDPSGDTDLDNYDNMFVSLETLKAFVAQIESNKN